MITMTWGDKDQRTQVPDKPASAVVQHKVAGSRTAAGNRYFKYRDRDVTRANMVRSSILSGYSEGSIINLVSVPKAGKTTLAMQECMMASVLGGRCLYMFNESPRWAFTRIIRKNKDSLGLSEADISNIYFCDMVDESLNVAQYKAIEEYMTRVWVGTIKFWLQQVKNPQYIVIDSFSEIVRKYIPQAYHALKYFTDELNKVLFEQKKFPVILLINQKSGGARERDDETVLGGYGLVHKTDGSVLLRLREMDRFMAERYNLRDGTLLHTIQVVEMRDVDYDTTEYVLIRKNGALTLGKALHELKSSKETDIYGRETAWSSGERIGE